MNTLSRYWVWYFCAMPTTSSLRQSKEFKGAGSGRGTIGPADYQAEGVLYLPEASHFSIVIPLPEGGNIGVAINDALRAIEFNNPDLKDVLPKTYNRFENSQTFGLF